MRDRCLNADSHFEALTYYCTVFMACDQPGNKKVMSERDYILHCHIKKCCWVFIVYNYVQVMTFPKINQVIFPLLLDCSCCAHIVWITTLKTLNIIQSFCQILLLFFFGEWRAAAAAAAAARPLSLQPNGVPCFHDKPPISAGNEHHLSHQQESNYVHSIYFSEWSLHPSGSPVQWVLLVWAALSHSFFECLVSFCKPRTLTVFYSLREFLRLHFRGAVWRNLLLHAAAQQKHRKRLKDEAAQFW